MDSKNKTILGLDLGTNSIGWALVQQNFEKKEGKILGMGSRIIPMGQDIIGNFESGNSVSQTASRTQSRIARRLRQRHLLRRQRLLRVLNILGCLPEHYSKHVDFVNRPGQFINNSEPKIPHDGNTFLFIDSFNEMLDEFKKSNPNFDLNHKIPHDWTIYYLRKKALSQKISKEELAWIILNFNQKRGYYQARGEESEENLSINEYVVSLKIVSITKREQDKKKPNRAWYDILLENGWIYSSTFSSKPEWENTEKEFLITEELDEHGLIKIIKDKKSDTSGKEKRKITTLPSFDEIDLMSQTDKDKFYKKIKIKTELAIEQSNKTVGTYIIENLIKQPKQKIRGKLIRTIERKFYKSELQLILKKQIELHPELFTQIKLNDCLRDLYKSNDNHRDSLSGKDFIHLIVDDIIFYQRPLRSQKSTITDCPFENRILKNSINGKNIIGKKNNIITKRAKVIHKSNPIYQEFRLWQFISNLRILSRDGNIDYTSNFLKAEEDIARLFNFLNTKKEVNHKDILNFLLTESISLSNPELKQSQINKEVNSKIKNYRWNYVFDDTQEKEDDKSKKYPCNETRYEFSKRLNKLNDSAADILDSTTENKLWHLIYSVTDKIQYEKALSSFMKKINETKKSNIDVSEFVSAFKNFPPFKNEYGAYSEKAIKKLLPLMRSGNYWNWDSIDSKTQKRIGNLINGEFDESIKETLRLKAIKNNLENESDFSGLPEWLARYIVYGETKINTKWNSSNDLIDYLKEFKQHSLRNPIVEQIITETLRVVGDIWNHYGEGNKDFFNEIHIELGREMKKTNEERNRLSKTIIENENTNLRLKALLIELKNNTDNQLNIEEVRPYSPIQLEALKIYEEGVLNSDIEIPDDILKISKAAQPSSTELIKYKLWLEQKYRSPYTGQIIPLSKLFTADYQIEHIIPQSRYFDDSLSNKVICEAAVNQLKDNMLGFEFISSFGGQIIELGLGKSVALLTKDAYEDFISKNYNKNSFKKNKLMLEEIPVSMIERQLNDTRYISKFINTVLSNIVRNPQNDEGLNSVNVVPCNGKITSALKRDWGLDDVWNDLIIDRFERLNKITNRTDFTTWNEKHQKFLPAIPFEFSKGFQKKRIDHRHHAMDALVIACASRDHVNLLNNISAESNMRHDLSRKLRQYERVQYTNKQTNELIDREVPKDFLKPWSTFTEDARKKLQEIIVSFKQNTRVINKSNNKFEKYIQVGEKKQKALVLQEKGDNWAIRKQLHRDTISGKVNLPHIVVPKGKILTATRKPLNTSFDKKTIASITDTGIQKILLNYLVFKNDDSETAFSPEGIDELNKNIEKFNDGKPHQPILKVRIFETGSKFPLGNSGNKKHKYVEAAKGANLFFAIYIDENNKRHFETIPLNIVIERQKQGLGPVPEMDDKGNKLLFHLSPNDLVLVNLSEINLNKTEIKTQPLNYSKNIYKMVSTTQDKLDCVPASYSFPIKTNEIGSNNKSQNTLDDIQIKANCIKISIDRLGNITKTESD